MLFGFENLIEIQSIMQKIAYSLILFSSTTNMTYYYVSIWGWIWFGKGICLLFSGIFIQERIIMIEICVSNDL